MLLLLILALASVQEVARDLQFCHNLIVMIRPFFAHIKEYLHSLVSKPWSQPEDLTYPNGLLEACCLLLQPDDLLAMTVIVS